MRPRLRLSPRGPSRPHTCLQRRPLSTPTAPPNPVPPPPASGYARLPTRALLLVSGPDAPKFLHGLTTASVPAPPAAGLYTAFLTAQGRVLFDAFIYPFGAGTFAAAGADEAGFVVEVDAAERGALAAHLRRHKLRSKVAVRAVEEGEVGVVAVWRGERWTGYGAGGGGGVGAEGALGVVDQRAPGMGSRVLLPAGRAVEGLEEASAEQYRVRRYLRGVPEGQGEVPREVAFPMNSNLDVMGAVDFKKGCYVGQELTIRTHHTGVVRRRVLPVQLYEGDEAPGHGYDEGWTAGSPRLDAEMTIEGKRGRPGRWIAGVGNVGLAMCRLEMMADLVVTSEPNTFDERDRFMVEAGDGKMVGVKAFVPEWLRGRMRAPKVQRRVD